MILYSILVYILRFTQAHIPVCLDGTIIDNCSSTTTRNYVLLPTVVMLGYDWWLCMVIKISVQYSGGLLPDIILPVDPRLLPVGNLFKYHVVALYS